MMGRLDNYVVTVNLIKLALTLAWTAVLFSCFGSTANAQWKDADLEWTLKRDRDGIQIFLTKVPGSKFRAILSIMEVEASTGQLAALVMDLDNCPNWAAMCKSAEIIERISASECYVHSINDAPFPVRDRDIVAHVQWFYDKANGKVSMRSDATPDRLPKRKGIVRVQYASSEWHFTPLNNGMVLVENYAHVDPTGNVPAWLTNLLIVDSPYRTLKNMRKLISTGAYSDASVGFIPVDAHLGELESN
ncbi:MAG: START domain-containing protein [Arenicella sp.]|nr:START domain-containing protein [Arenicella sp.]